MTGIISSASKYIKPTRLQGIGRRNIFNSKKDSLWVADRTNRNNGIRGFNGRVNNFV